MSWQVWTHWYTRQWVVDDVVSPDVVLVNAECVRLVDVCETIVEEVETVDADPVVVVVRMVCVELPVLLLKVLIVAVRVREVEVALALRPQTRLQSVPHQG